MQAKTGAPSAATPAALVVVGRRALVGQRQQADQVHAGRRPATPTRLQHLVAVAALVEVGDQDEDGLLGPA